MGLGLQNLHKDSHLLIVDLDIHGAGLEAILAGGGGWAFSAGAHFH